MIRLKLFLIILSIAMGSCSSPLSEVNLETEPVLKTPTMTVNPTDTPHTTVTPKAPTISPTAHFIDTPTMSPEPTITALESDQHNISALIVGQPITITQINMIDPMNGWGIGHQSRSGDRILFTQDGGSTWNERTPPISGADEPDIDQLRAWAYFYDRQNAWSIILPQFQPPQIYAPIIWRTADSGLTWEPSEPLPLTDAESFFMPEGFSFIDPLQGWLLVHVDAGMSHDYSNLYSTSDGGRTWIRLIDPYGEGLQSLQNTGLAFADHNFGWVTKDNLAVFPGTLLEQSNDGGLTWEDVLLPEPQEFDWFNEISQCATSFPTFIEDSRGIVLVNCNTFSDINFTYTYISSDKGESWQTAQLPTSTQSLLFIDNKLGWALGRDIYQSSDGGLSWVRIKSVNWDGQFSFVDDKTGWAVAHADDAIALVFTQDGGYTWQIIEPIYK